jgi:hypothetical protein
MGMIDVRDAVDLHCHSAPEIFQRIGDTREICRRAGRAGMRGILFKAHHTATYDRAYFVNAERKRLADETGEPTAFEAFGSITLNHYVGGLNLRAVSAALREGCKAVFMPSMDAAYHARVFGGTGGYGIPSMTAAEAGAPAGLTVVDQAGQLTPEVAEIVDLAVRHQALLGTSHLSPEEQLSLADYAVPRGAAVVVSHAFFLPGVDLAFCQKMAEKGALIELAATVAFPMAIYQAGGMTLKQALELVHSIGADRCVLSTDAGQPFNPWPDEALRIFAQLLHEVGVSERNLHQMMVANPRRLLRIGEAKE